MKHILIMLCLAIIILADRAMAMDIMLPEITTKIRWCVLDVSPDLPSMSRNIGALRLVNKDFCSSIHRITGVADVNGAKNGKQTIEFVHNYLHIRFPNITCEVFAQKWPLQSYFETHDKKSFNFMQDIQQILEQENPQELFNGRCIDVNYTWKHPDLDRSSSVLSSTIMNLASFYNTKDIDIPTGVKYLTKLLQCGANANIPECASACVALQDEICSEFLKILFEHGLDPYIHLPNGDSIEKGLGYSDNPASLKIVNQKKDELYNATIIKLDARLAEIKNGSQILTDTRRKEIYDEINNYSNFQTLRSYIENHTLEQWFNELEQNGLITLEEFKNLLEQCPNLDYVDYRGDTILHQFVRKWEKALIGMIPRAGDPYYIMLQICKILLPNSSMQHCLNVQNNDGCTPLLLLVKQGYNNCMRSHNHEQIDTFKQLIKLFKDGGTDLTKTTYLEGYDVALYERWFKVYLDNVCQECSKQFSSQQPDRLQNIVAMARKIAKTACRHGIWFFCGVLLYKMIFLVVETLDKNWPLLHKIS